MIKAFLGYDIEPGLSPAEYDRWLWDTHVPDRLANPHLDRIVFNTVTGKVRGDQTFYRIAELHFRDVAAFEAYEDWNREHPVAHERTSAGRTVLRFNVLAEDVDVDKGRLDRLVVDAAARVPTYYAQPGAKAVLGYDIEPHLSVAEYDEWLWQTHAPDLLENPHLDRLVFNTVKRKLRGETVFFRISELHFHSAEAYVAFEKWRAKNPVPVERSPAGRTVFRFYVMASVQAANRH